MASTFSELFSDFLMASTLYTEVLNVTELMFMRLYTRGIQRFQYKTEYMEAAAAITKNVVPPYWEIPAAALRVKELRDSNGNQLIQLDFNQWGRNFDKYSGGYLEVPTNYDIRLGHKTAASRFYTYHNRELYIHPALASTETTLNIWFIPDMHAISSNSTQWLAWFPYEVNFDGMFRNATLPPDLAPFEQLFLDYAIAEYVKSRGSMNYRVYEDSFKAGTKEAELLKPVKFHHGVCSYFMAPES